MNIQTVAPSLRRLPHRTTAKDFSFPQQSFSASVEVVAIDRAILAAEGWIELGELEQAAVELYDCPDYVKSSAEYLKASVDLFARQNRWKDVETVCDRLMNCAPNDHFATRYYAEALHQQGRSREAFATFQYAPLDFKQGSDYFYALARYLCVLGNKFLAISCVAKAIDVDPILRGKALADPDLERVWQDLQQQDP